LRQPATTPDFTVTDPGRHVVQAVRVLTEIRLVLDQRAAAFRRADEFRGEPDILNP
jgi:hypothetical protein